MLILNPSRYKREGTEEYKELKEKGFRLEF